MTKVLVIVCLAVICLAVLCSGYGDFNEEQGRNEDNIDGVLRNLREAAESHSRLKRACSWWFQWKVTGARADRHEVTKKLDDLFRDVCNEYGK